MADQPRKRVNPYTKTTTDPEGRSRELFDLACKREHIVGKYYSPSELYSKNYDKIDWGK